VVLVSIVRVETPDPPANSVTAGGLNELPGPKGEKMAVNVTLPEKPFRLVTVMVDEPEAPARMLNVAWLEETTKLAPGVTVKVSEVEFLIDPATPFTVTV